MNEYKLQKRLKYEEERRTSLIGFAEEESLSLVSKVNILNKIIGNEHEPSTGRYKEKLLLDFLANKV